MGLLGIAFFAPLIAPLKIIELGHEFCVETV